MDRGRPKLTERLKAASDEGRALEAEYNRLRLRAKQYKESDRSTWQWPAEWRDFVKKHTGERFRAGRFPSTKIAADKHNVCTQMITRYRRAAKHPELLAAMDRGELSASAAFKELMGGTELQNLRREGYTGSELPSWYTAGKS